MGEAHRTIGEAHRTIGEAHRTIGETHRAVGETHRAVGETHSPSCRNHQNIAPVVTLNTIFRITKIKSIMNFNLTRRNPMPWYHAQKGFHPIAL